MVRRVCTVYAIFVYIVGTAGHPLGQFCSPGDAKIAFARHEKHRDVARFTTCYLDSECRRRPEHRLLSSRKNDVNSIIWVGESVTLHAYVSLLRLFGFEKITRTSFDRKGVFCSVWRVPLSPDLIFFFVHSFGLYDKPVDDRERWKSLSRQGVSKRDQFVAFNKFENGGCFNGKSLEAKLRELLRLIEGRVYVFLQVGLWDVCFNGGDAGGFEAQYVSLLRSLTKQPKVHSVSAALPTAMHNTHKQHFKRYNDTLISRQPVYATQIMQACRSFGVNITSVPYHLTLSKPARCLDGVHYDEGVSTMLASIAQSATCDLHRTPEYPLWQQSMSPSRRKSNARKRRLYTTKAKSKANRAAKKARSRAKMKG